ncbi:unnamed protein product [Rangifer tarandus platyrhynchus]|uniref:Uncharacterized protein n=1 Tax=Rangifer tarandus platyrhynchus TaxID=3082113 RepID=A0AC59YB58_RANTA
METCRGGGSPARFPRNQLHLFLAADPIPTPPPDTTQPRPSASLGVSPRAAPPAIGQTRHSAISAYSAALALIGGRRQGAVTVGGAPPSGPLQGSSPNAGDTHAAGRLSRRQAVTLVTAEALHWEGCRRP